MRLGSTTSRIRTGLAAVAGTLLLTGAGLVGTGAPAAADDTLYQISDRDAGWCLDMKSFTIESGAQVQRHECNDGSNQHWAAALVRGTSYNLVNEHSELCIDVRGGSTLSDAEIQQFDCNDSAAQLWNRIPVLVDGVLWERLRNKGSNYCLDTDLDTDLIVQRPCDTSIDTQLWHFNPTDPSDVPVA